MKVHTPILISATVLTGLVLAGCSTTSSETPKPTSSAAAEAPAHWTYEGADGPAQWGLLDDDYATCGIGTTQSPVDLPAVVPATGDYVDIAASSADGDVIDTGHTMQFVADETASTVAYGENEYKALQTHFHAPSEHTIDGKAAAAEFHFVHADEDGNLLVVGVLVEAGVASEAWAPFVNAVADAEDDKETDATLNMAMLLPQNLSHYAYKGSLTTPPCSEGVQWIVLSTPIELSVGQIAVLDEASHHNARPTQPIGEREISGGTGQLVND